MAKIMFDMPRGSAEFDELEPGEKMAVSCTIRKEGQDRGCLVAVDGRTLAGYSEDDSDEEEADEGEDDSEDEGDMMSVLEEQM